MHARVSSFEGPPDKMDEGMRYFREQVLPKMKQTDGFKGAISLHTARVARRSG